LADVDADVDVVGRSRKEGWEERSKGLKLTDDLKVVCFRFFFFFFSFSFEKRRVYICSSASPSCLVSPLSVLKEAGGGNKSSASGFGEEKKEDEGKKDQPPTHPKIQKIKLLPAPLFFWLSPHHFHMANPNKTRGKDEREPEKPEMGLGSRKGETTRSFFVFDSVGFGSELEDVLIYNEVMFEGEGRLGNFFFSFWSSDGREGRENRSNVEGRPGGDVEIAGRLSSARASARLTFLPRSSLSQTTNLLSLSFLKSSVLLFISLSLAVE